jgi:hypothetical protein
MKDIEGKGLNSFNFELNSGQFLNKRSHFPYLCIMYISQGCFSYASQEKQKILDIFCHVGRFQIVVN